MNDQKQDWFLYHALYHIIAHWAALVAAIGLLATIGVVISTATKPLMGIRLWYCQAVILGIAGGCIFFMLKMNGYTQLMKEMQASDTPMTSDKYEARLSKFGVQKKRFVVITSFATAFLLVSTTIVLWYR